MDNLCNFCIEVLEWWANHTCFTYSEINVFLFIFFQPLLIVLFAITTIINSIIKNSNVKSFISVFTIIAIILLIILTIIIVFTPIMFVSFDIPK